MGSAANLQIELLKFQIELDESNYRYAVELEKDYDILWRMRVEIRILKDELREMERNERIRLYKRSETDAGTKHPD